MSVPDFISEAKKFIGQRAPDKDIILQLTACMSPAMRKAWGVLKAWIEFSEDKTLEPHLTTLQVLGRTQWGRDILTDLALLIGESEEIFIDLEKLGITKA